MKRPNLPACGQLFNTLLAACFLVASFYDVAHAQDGSNLDQVQRSVKEINNGTNPTLLTTQMGVQYQYNEINPPLNTGLLELF